jgi:hypothetical protein
LITPDIVSRLHDLEQFSASFFKVADKQGNLSPFIFNRAQQYVSFRLDEQLRMKSRVRALCLKGRQQGISTLIQARDFHKVITGEGKRAFNMTHAADATDNLFGITKRYLDNLPDGLCPKPTKLNTSEMIFSQFNSSYRVGTAGNKTTGRSQTIQLFHGSEVAFWENTEQHVTGILQAVPRSAGTEVVLESTANGIGNYFHSMWLDASNGKSDFQPIFVPWYWQEEYTESAEGFTLTEEEREYLHYYSKDGLKLEHLAWRRIKLVEFSRDEERALELFKQEYPFNANESFLNPISNTFIKSKYVQRARHNDVISESGLVIGVDPADDKDGSDRTTIIRRRGRQAYKLEKLRNHNTMQIAGHIVNIIKTEKPKKVYIDCIGIGKGIVDRLQEMGFDMVEGINVAKSAMNKERFGNRRAELWSECCDWLMQELEVQIPDDDELQSDLCSVGYFFKSGGQLMIESKEDLKKRGMNSPDCADALMHTFSGGFYEQDAIFVEPTNTLKTRGKFY